MFTFIKKLFGFDQETMKAAGVQTEQAPYKVPEPVAVTPEPVAVETLIVFEPLPSAVVLEATSEPVTAKPDRKPRAPKTPAAKTVVKKAAPVKKAAAIKPVRKVK